MLQLWFIFLSLQYRFTIKFRKFIVMQKEIQTYQNSEKLISYNKAISNRIKIKQKLCRRPTRASKHAREFVIQKEQGWNESFINDKIPLTIQPIVIASRRLYRKKSQNTRPLVSQTSRNAPTELKFRIHKSSSPNNLFSVRSMPTHSRTDRLLSQSSITLTIKSLEQQIDKIYTRRKVSQCHINTMKLIRQKIDNKQYEWKLLRSQLQDLKSPHSCIFSLDLLCEARQNSISKIKKLVEAIKLDSSNFGKQIKNIKQHLVELRSLSISCIQKILKWKQSILQFCRLVEEKIDVNFSYCKQDNGNYLLRILYDSEFLYMSGLFNETSFPDPFFLSYQKELEMDMKKYFKLRACELLLLQESI